MHTDYLFILERTHSLDARLMSDALHGLDRALLKRRWVIQDGHLTSIQVPVFDSEEEVEVEINEETETFSYRTPGPHSCILTRPLAEIAFYSVNMDMWMEEISSLLNIAPQLRAKKREIIPGHLWHLGDVRVGRSKRFAPIYVARRLGSASQDWKESLLNPERPGHGVMLTAQDTKIDLPNGHRACSLDRLLVLHSNGVSCDFALLDRLLTFIAPDAENSEEYFNAENGELKLARMAQPYIFACIQRSVIALLWKDRHLSSVKWSYIKEQTNCGKDPGSVFGKNWDTWLERDEGQRGYYRLRRHAKKP
uniref:Uncharacterized protein n=1 Tax=Candidatus Nitrotoga fabula TaxID=2182327 RepID=A0A2X0SFU7_9PROT|nr:conserved protein of unknown function [Candidatus Nitrotoga fabula]